jgi:hypothetical protein
MNNHQRRVWRRNIISDVAVQYTKNGAPRQGIPTKKNLYTRIKRRATAAV